MSNMTRSPQSDGRTETAGEERSTGGEMFSLFPSRTPASPTPTALESFRIDGPLESESTVCKDFDDFVDVVGVVAPGKEREFVELSRKIAVAMLGKQSTSGTNADMTYVRHIQAYQKTHGERVYRIINRNNGFFRVDSILILRWLRYEVEQNSRGWNFVRHSIAAANKLLQYMEQFAEAGATRTAQNDLADKVFRVISNDTFPQDHQYVKSTAYANDEAKGKKKQEVTMKVQSITVHSRSNLNTISMLYHKRIGHTSLGRRGAIRLTHAAVTTLNDAHRTPLKSRRRTKTSKSPISARRVCSPYPPGPSWTRNGNWTHRT